MTPQKNILFHGLFVALLLLGVVLASQPARKRMRQQNREQEVSIKPLERIEDLKLTNKTTGLQVVEIKKLSDKMLELTFKNEYNKSITGFEVSVGGMRVQTELILGGDEQQFISPGSTFEKAYAAQEGLDRAGIQILGVVFEDGTSDGDLRAIKEITDYRLGMKTERQRVLALLNKVIAADNQKISIGLEELEADIYSSVSLNQQDSKLDNVGLGIRNERRRMLEEIRILRAKHQYAQMDEGKARQLKEDLAFVKVMSENIIKLASSRPLRSPPQ
jgi:hypothetical protein